MYELLTVAGVLCLVAWLALLFTRHKRPLREEIRAMESFRHENALPAELDPAKLRQNLTRYAGDQSALQKYVQSLKDRFEMSVGIKVIEQKIRETHVRKELLDAAYETLKSQGRLQRIGREEELEDLTLQTKILEQQQTQQKIQQDMEASQEIANLDREYLKKKRLKDIADLDKEPPEPKPKSTREEVLASKLAARKKIREQIQAEEQDELLKFRLEKRPNMEKDAQVYEDEAAWLAGWREVGGDQSDFVLGEYENIKKRYRKMLTDALEELEK